MEPSNALTIRLVDAARQDGIVAGTRSRNPFAMRSSESIDREMTFLRLFGPGALESLRDDCMSNKVTVIRSGPGGGKTSLLRLFRPESLNQIHEHDAEYRELRQKLEVLSAMSRSGPNVLGVYLRLNDYAPLQDLDVGEPQKDGLLFSLIGARLTLKMLIGILALKNLERGDLRRIHVCRPEDGDLTAVPLPCNGEELFEWASSTERNICDRMNRFNGSAHTPMPVFDSLEHIRMMAPENIRLDGEQIVPKTLIMIDDLHNLHKSQRAALLDKTATERYPAAIWFAERLESLDLRDMDPMAAHGREYTLVNLEEYWESTRRRKFENLVRVISEKRARFAKIDYAIDSLEDHVESQGDGASFKPQLLEMSREIRKKLRKVAHITRQFDLWIEDAEVENQSPLAAALKWKSVEIKVARVQKNAQKKLFGKPLEVEEHENDLRAAAEIFAHSEYDVPYYYGFARIATMSNFNIERFLEISKELFDLIVAQSITGMDPMVDASDQEQVIKKIAKRHWDGIQKNNANGRAVKTFLCAFRDFAQEQSRRPNAPYAPGITGFGIRRSQFEKLADPAALNGQRELKDLADVLRTCLAQNYLKARYESRQGQKAGEGSDVDDVTILYLNRLFCSHLGLPLSRGGWRHKTIEDLCGWMRHAGSPKG